MNWDLSSIYKGFDAPDFTNDLNEVPKLCGKISELANKLNSFEDVEEFILLMESYDSVLKKLYAFSSFTFSADTKSENATKYMYKLEEYHSSITKAFVKYNRFLVKLSEDGDIRAEILNSTKVNEYLYMILKELEWSKHLLTEQEEALYSKLSMTGSSAWGMLHDKLISQLKCILKTKDGEKTITINECRNLAYDGDRDVRKAAYEAELSAYQDINESSAACINGIKGEVNTMCSLRGFANPLEASLENSALSKAAHDALFAAIDENIDVLRDYLRCKAKYFGETGGLPFYDLFAPVDSVSGYDPKMNEAAESKKLSYQDACNFVVDNFARFSEKMADVARMAIKNNWIDVMPKEGKVAGAFCGSIEAIKEFRVLLNFGDSISDAITLAHELGHGYHSMNIMDERILNTNYPMPLAETASTFCEILVNNAALQTLQGGEKLRLLENSLQDSTQVIVDIYSRYRFEKSVFETRNDHPLSVDELNGLMEKAQAAAYGDALEPGHKSMWVVKPHYYSTLSYYNYPYAFGHLLANGLFEKYSRDPVAFPDAYDNFLRKSGSMSIVDACKLMDIDIEDKAFWVSSINVIKDRIEVFKGMINCR